jgi:hypothetical protein
MKQDQDLAMRTIVTVPDANDGQRVREIFDAIRKHPGETTLPAFERDRLERLRERF